MASKERPKKPSEGTAPLIPPRPFGSTNSLSLALTDTEPASQSSAVVTNLSTAPQLRLSHQQLPKNGFTTPPKPVSSLQPLSASSNASDTQPMIAAATKYTPATGTREIQANSGVTAIQNTSVVVSNTTSSNSNIQHHGVKGFLNSFVTSMNGKEKTAIASLNELTMEIGFIQGCLLSLHRRQQRLAAMQRVRLDCQSRLRSIQSISHMLDTMRLQGSLRDYRGNGW